MVASVVNPSGAAVTESPWLIHTVCTSGVPSSRVPTAVSGHVAVVAPYSRTPVRSTVPPRALAMTWNP